MIRKIVTTFNEYMNKLRVYVCENNEDDELSTSQKQS